MMASKQHATSGFKRDRRGGKTVYVKALPGGAEIHRNSECDFSAYDKDGHYLGFWGDVSAAEHAAREGFVGNASIDAASELTLWAAWNDAINSGARVMVGTDGRQVLAVSDHVYLRATRDKSGWSVEALNDAELSEEYWDVGTARYELRVITDGKFRPA